MRAQYFAQTNLRNTYVSVAIVQGFGFHITVMGIVSVATGIISLIVHVLVIPKLVGRDTNKPLTYAFLTCCVSNILLFFTPGNHLTYLIAVIIINSAGLVIINMLIESLTANAMPEAGRASIMGLATIITVLISAPVQYLGGYLADLPGAGPRLPLLIILAIMLVSVILSSAMRNYRQD